MLILTTLDKYLNKQKVSQEIKVKLNESLPNSTKTNYCYLLSNTF